MTDEITLDAPETRLERFLAAAAGVEGITLDEPETRIERYLYKIAQGGGGSGGGPLVVHETVSGGTRTLDKAWQEIANAIASTGAVIVAENEGTIVSANVITSAHYDDLSAEYSVFTLYLTYITASASGYPSLNDDDEM